jgi:phospholipid/cholesterol/gamma-HCH transport system substrate-binding protein
MLFSAPVLTTLTAALTTLTAGCGGLQNVPLPGGADIGANPYRITAEFSDVLELVPQSLVKVNDVSVGAVREITLTPDTWHAMVTLELNRTVELPANATARVRTTSLLGEKFVELAAPTGEPATSRLVAGAVIPLSRTSRATDVEEVLGALSLLLNGGGVDQIRTIATELNAALSGHEPQLRALLGDLNILVSGLDARKAEINRALDGLNRLSATLTQQRGQIITALDGLPPGLRVLADQRTQLTGTLVALDRLSAIATDTINRSREDLVADLQLLRPTLMQLANAGADLPNALELIATYPFTDGAARDAFKGDYANLYVRADLNLGTVLDNLSESGQPLMGVPPPLRRPLAPGRPPLGPLLGELSRVVPPPPSASGGPYGMDPDGIDPDGMGSGGMSALLAPLLRSPPRGGPA